ncbi:hypothetical protein ONZ51_g5295 [Trametes cubensis]|uniref:Uncharacterized protein n=1 Tax=Trametes cubensis TaxID=1111947 RepID=A0AAD7TWI7_9APHY|nr:hypothetical protein ONZ51_g5295 [Trametes cubensis]
MEESCTPRVQTNALKEPQEDVYTSGSSSLWGCCLLPLELVESVIQHASCDKTALAACTLVSQCWSAVANTYPFSSLTIFEYQSPLDLCSNFLDSHPDIARYVRRLKLQGDLNYSARHVDKVTPSLVAFAELTAQLTELQVLHLREVTTSNIIAAPPPVLRSKALIMNRCGAGEYGWFSPQALYTSMQTITLALYNTQSTIGIRDRERMDLERFDGALLDYLPLLAKLQVEVLRQDGEHIELSEYTQTVEEIMPKCTQRGMYIQQYGRYA